MPLSIQTIWKKDPEKFSALTRRKVPNLKEPVSPKVLCVLVFLF